MFAILRTHKVLQMFWCELEPSKPSLVVRATMENDWHYLTDAGPREYSLEGDYIAIDSLQGILIWNWKEDRICTLHPEGQEWVSASACRVCLNLTEVGASGKWVWFPVEPAAPLHLHYTT
jgi:hypothetical protein